MTGWVRWSEGCQVLSPYYRPIRWLRVKVPVENQQEQVCSLMNETRLSVFVIHDTKFKKWCLRFDHYLVINPLKVLLCDWPVTASYCRRLSEKDIQEHLQGHLKQRPAGPLPPAERATHPTTQWHDGNSSTSWREGAGLSTLFFFFLNCFSLIMPRLLTEAEPKTWESRFFFLLWLICKPAKLPFIHTETVSLLCIVCSFWGKDSGWLRRSA